MFFGGGGGENVDEAPYREHGVLRLTLFLPCGFPTNF
jgi:hypothetical protein